MAITPKQFIYITDFHQQNLNELLERYIDLPEAPGILAAMLYLQESKNRARAAADALQKEKEKEKEKGPKDADQ